MIKLDRQACINSGNICRDVLSLGKIKVSIGNKGCSLLLCDERMFQIIWSFAALRLTHFGSDCRELKLWHWSWWIICDSVSELENLFKTFLPADCIVLEIQGLVFCISATVFAHGFESPLRELSIGNLLIRAIQSESGYEKVRFWTWDFFKMSKWYSNAANIKAEEIYKPKRLPN